MSRLALCDTSGPLTDLLQKMSGEGGEQWLLGLTRFLRKENPWEPWRTIVLGEFRSSEDFLEAFQREGLYASDWAKDIMSKLEFVASFSEENDEETDLVDYSTAELVGDNEFTTEEVFAGETRLGLLDCPAWMGPKLRYDYRNQSDGEIRILGMKPIRDSSSRLSVFSLLRGGSMLWLGARCAGPDSVWSPDSRWLFRRPRKYQKPLDA